MLAESHRRQIAPGGALVRSRGGIGRQLALWAGGRAWDWPEDPAGSRHDGRPVGQAPLGGSASPPLSTLGSAGFVCADPSEPRASERPGTDKPDTALRLHLNFGECQGPSRSIFLG